MRRFRQHKIAAVLLAGCFAAVGLKAQTGKDGAEEPYGGIDKKYHETLAELEKRHRDLFKQWRELVYKQIKLHELQSTFGTRKRASIQRALPRLERDVESERTDFKEDFYELREDYEEPLNELKEREMKLGVEVGFDDGSNPNYEREKKRLDKIVEEMTDIDRKIDALDRLMLRVSQTEKEFDEGRLFGFNDREWQSFAKDYPDAVETRREVQDYMVDLQEVKKLKGTDEWDRNAERKMNYLEQGLERSIEALESDVEGEISPMERDADRLRQKIERLNERIERSSKPERYKSDRDEMQEELEELEEAIVQLKKLAEIKQQKK